MDGGAGPAPPPRPCSPRRGPKAFPVSRRPGGRGRRPAERTEAPGRHSRRADPVPESDTEAAPGDRSLRAAAGRARRAARRWRRPPGDAGLTGSPRGRRARPPPLPRGPAGPRASVQRREKPRARGGHAGAPWEAAVAAAAVRPARLAPGLACAWDHARCLCLCLAVVISALRDPTPLFPKCGVGCIFLNLTDFRAKSKSLAWQRPCICGRLHTPVCPSPSRTLNCISVCTCFCLRLRQPSVAASPGTTFRRPSSGSKDSTFSRWSSLDVADSGEVPSSPSGLLSSFLTTLSCMGLFRSSLLGSQYGLWEDLSLNPDSSTY